MKFKFNMLIVRFASAFWLNFPWLGNVHVLPVFPVYKTTRFLYHGLIIGIFPNHKTMHGLIKDVFSGNGVSNFRS